MKKLFLFAFIILSNHIYAQTPKVDVSDLYTPSSPGFVLMDKAPSSVDKPTTPKAFGASLLNLAQGGAVQVTPFWLYNHPSLDVNNYTKNAAPIFQTFNISLATIKSDTNYSYALGFKTQVLRFYSQKTKGDIKDAVHLIKYGSDSQAPLSDVAVRMRKIKRDSANLKIAESQELKDEILENIADEWENIKEDTAKVNKENKDYQALVNKPFFVMELAGAIVGNTPNTPFSNTSELAVSKSGAWVNFRFSPDKCPLDFVGVARYTYSTFKTKSSNSDSAFIDYGVGLFYSNKKFDISAEYVNRYDESVKKNYDRLAFAVNYKLSDKIVFVGSLGKNFDNVENIFAIIGIHMGISGSVQKVATAPGSSE